MDGITVFVFVVLWFLFSYAVSSMAKGRGRDSGLYFIVGILISPLLALIILLVKGDTPIQNTAEIKTEQKDSYLELLEKRIENQVDENILLPNDLKYENLEKIGRLLEKGILTKEEFEIEKHLILKGEKKAEISLDFGNKIEKKITKQPNTEIKNVNYFNDDFFDELKIEIDSCTSFYSSKIDNSLINFLNENLKSKQEAKDLLVEYKKRFNVDLIEKLQSLTNSYRGKEKVLTIFIEFGIVDKSYPHALI